MTNEDRQLLADIRKEASSGLSCITFGNNCISRLWQIVNLCDSVLDKPPRNCDRMGVDDAFSAFSFMCDNTNCSDCPYKRHNRFGDRELCAMLFLYDNGNGGKERESTGGEKR